MKVDHTRDMVRLSMLDSAAGESNDAGDDNSSCFGSLSGGAAVPEEDAEEDGGVPRTPSGHTEPLLADSRVAGLGPGELYFGGMRIFFFRSFGCGSLLSSPWQGRAEQGVLFLILVLQDTPNLYRPVQSVHDHDCLDWGLPACSSPLSTAAARPE